MRRSFVVWSFRRPHISVTIDPSDRFTAFWRQPSRFPKRRRAFHTCWQRKDDAIALDHLFSRQYAAQRIVHMHIGSRLIEHQIIGVKAGGGFAQALQLGAGVGWLVEPRDLTQENPLHGIAIERIQNHGGIRL